MESVKVYQIRELQYNYDHLFLLKVKKLNIPKGKIIGIVGPNGSGKTTLLKILAFLYEKSSGELIFDDKIIKKEDMKKVRQNVTMLMEEPYLLHRSVRNNIRYALNLVIKNNKSIDYEHYLSMLGLNSENHLLKNYNQLSRGESKRVAMLMHLIINREVLILDEPTNNIDERSKIYLENTLVKLRASGKTIIFSSHDIMFTLKHADTIHSLYNGSLYNDMLLNIIEFNMGKIIANFHRIEDKDKNSILKKQFLSENKIVFNANSVKYFLNNNCKGLVKATIASVALYNNRCVLTIDIEGNICYLYYNIDLINKNVFLPGSDIFLSLKENVLNI